jgi:hypothetical protein
MLIQEALLKVEVLPTQRQDLGDPKPGAHGNDRHGPVWFPERLGEFIEFLRFERLRVPDSRRSAPPCVGSCSSASPLSFVQIVFENGRIQGSGHHDTGRNTPADTYPAQISRPGELLALRFQAAKSYR